MPKTKKKTYKEMMAEILKPKTESKEKRQTKGNWWRKIRKITENMNT